MDSDSLPPGVTRGPYKGSRQPRATAWLLIGPAVGAAVWARLVIDRWIRDGDAWTWVFVVGFVVSLACVAGGVRELRLRRRSTEPNSPQSGRRSGAAVGIADVDDARRCAPGMMER